MVGADFNPGAVMRILQVRETFARRKDKLKERRTLPLQHSVQVKPGASINCVCAHITGRPHYLLQGAAGYVWLLLYL